VYSPQAEAQLLAIFSQITQASSPGIAVRYPGLRVFGFRRRVSIAFEVSGNVVTIAGIIYGGQNLESVFEE
jgi:plasmid stabilization system protein ParE